MKLIFSFQSLTCAEAKEIKNNAIAANKNLIFFICFNFYGDKFRIKNRACKKITSPIL
jgi:hypothetical protein